MKNSLESMICACFCLCRSLEYCCLRAEMSTVSLSLSTLLWLGPSCEELELLLPLLCLLDVFRRFGEEEDEEDDAFEILPAIPPGLLKTAEIPKVAATAICSSSSSM